MSQVSSLGTNNPPQERFNPGMLEAEVRPMTDSEFTFPRPQPGRSFRRSFSALPGQVGRNLRCIVQEIPGFPAEAAMQ